MLLHELSAKLHDINIQHHSVDLLKDLHWLLVRGRADYKIAVLCYKAVEL